MKHDREDPTAFDARFQGDRHNLIRLGSDGYRRQVESARNLAEVHKQVGLFTEALRLKIEKQARRDARLRKALEADPLKWEDDIAGFKIENGQISPVHNGDGYRDQRVSGPAEARFTRTELKAQDIAFSAYDKVRAAFNESLGSQALRVLPKHHMRKSFARGGKIDD